MTMISRQANLDSTRVLTLRDNPNQEKVNKDGGIAKICECG